MVLDLKKVESKIPREEINEPIETSLSSVTSFFTADNFCQPVFAIYILRKVAKLYVILPVFGDFMSFLSVSFEIASIAIAHTWLAAVMVLPYEAEAVAKSAPEAYSTWNSLLPLARTEANKRTRVVESSIRLRCNIPLILQSSSDVRG